MAINRGLEGMSESTILVVDDELFFRRLYAEILTEEGFQVETVATGEDAIARLQVGGIDVLVTDLVMPGISGLDLLAQARTLENPPEVILATGHASIETAVQALKNGARDYLIKPFNPEELRHLVHTCLEQRRLLDENTLLKSQIHLFQKGQALAGTLEIDRLLNQALKTLLQEVGGGRCFTLLLSKKAISRVVSLGGIEEPAALDFANRLLPLLRDLPGFQLLRRQDLDQDPGWPTDVHTVLLFPLRSQKGLKGALVIFNPTGREFPKAIPHGNLQFLAEQTSLGFDNAYRFHGVKELIYSDDLTGLYNYRYLQVALEQEIRRSERYGLEFSLAFIDLDNFKSLNDTHGHLSGSAALKEVARLLQKCVREVDILFRYGGDEFTALLIETHSNGARIVAERMRQSIERHLFLTGTETPFRLTATVGFATFPENATDKRSIIDLADRAMYEGKKERNVIRGAREIDAS